MSVVSSEPIAFRCTTCWQSIGSTSCEVGNTVACSKGGEPALVPEATEERIKLGQQLLEAAQIELEAVTQPMEFAVDGGELSDQEIFQQAKQEVRSQLGPEAMVCSKLKRFIGHLIDSIAILMALVAGAILTAVLFPSANAAITVPMVVTMFALPMMLAVVQWCMTALDGRTLGKYCVNTKIVNLAGDPPGFFQGVILRSWVVFGLNFVPFFGLIDAVFIFANESNRCVHDYISGTFVIDAS